MKNNSYRRTPMNEPAEMTSKMGVRDGRSLSPKIILRKHGFESHLNLGIKSAVSSLSVSSSGLGRRDIN